MWLYDRQGEKNENLTELLSKPLTGGSLESSKYFPVRSSWWPGERKSFKSPESFLMITSAAGHYDSPPINLSLKIELNRVTAFHFESPISHRQIEMSDGLICVARAAATA